MIVRFLKRHLLVVVAVLPLLSCFAQDLGDQIHTQSETRAAYWHERGYDFDPKYMTAFAMDAKVKDIERSKYWKEKGYNFDPNHMTAFSMDAQVSQIEAAQAGTSGKETLDERRARLLSQGYVPLDEYNRQQQASRSLVPQRAQGLTNAFAHLLGSVFGAALGVCLGALAVQFVTEKLASFKPPYTTTFLATFIGYVVNYAIGFVVGYGVIANKGQMTGMVTLLTMVIGFFVQASFYSFMVKSPDGVPLGYGRSCIVSLSQLVVTALLIGGISMIRIAGGEATR